MTSLLAATERTGKGREERKFMRYKDLQYLF